MWNGNIGRLWSDWVALMNGNLSYDEQALRSIIKQKQFKFGTLATTGTHSCVRHAAVVH